MKLLKTLAWTMRPFPPLVSPDKRTKPESRQTYLDYAVDAAKEGTKYGDFYDWAVREGLNKDSRFFTALLNAFKTKHYDKTGQWAAVEEVAMKPYKPKMGPRRLKNDPEHRLMRQANKRKTTTDKVKDARQDKIYRRKNKNQLLQRHKRSTQLHKRPETAMLHTILQRLEG